MTFLLLSPASPSAGSPDEAASDTEGEGGRREGEGGRGGREREGEEGERGRGRERREREGEGGRGGREREGEAGRVTAMGRNCQTLMHLLQFEGESVDLQYQVL